MFKIALNAGHGKNTAGKRCLKKIDPKETREWVLNSRICDKIEEKLKAYSGYELIRLDDTTGKTDVPLKTRTSKANKFNADFYLAIHHNAGVNGKSGGGVIAIVYKTIKDGSVTNIWQKSLYNEIIKKTGLKGNRAVPLQKQDLHEVRESAMPAVLLECGFMDSTTDTPIILKEDFAEKVADACVNVLADKGNLKKKTAAKTVKPQTKQKTTAAKKTDIDAVARDVIRGLYGNGNERKQRLSALGLNYSVIQKRVNEMLK
ncbi:MAG: N-acetylmuramoyl-L-alanine amidase [Clostridia bacterium]|nr:N-acetylmuramoyl-L-alanine amidase [Clostridia bacterium]